MKYVYLIAKNLFRNKRRFVLTVLSIAVSLFVFSALVSLPAVANQILAATASSVRVVCHNKAGLTYSLPEAYRQRIAVAPHVEAVVAQSWFGGIYHEPSDQFPNWAQDHEQSDIVWPDWFSKADIEKFKRLRTACLVAPGTMRRFHWHVGQQVMLRGTVYPFNVTLTIVGTLTSKAPPELLIFRRDYLEELLGRAGLVSGFWVKVDEPSSVPRVIAELDETFANSSAETETESEAAFIGGFLSNYRAVFRMASIFGLIVVATIGLVAANTAAMSIRERRSEIAVMRSMGFGAGLVLSLLLVESLIVGVAGGLLGCGSAYLVLKVIAIGGPGLSPLGAIRMPPAVLAEGLFLAALIGLLSGFVPARSATRRNIVDTLRLVA
jgi:putative ABC transport system permease protein